MTVIEKLTRNIQQVNADFQAIKNKIIEKGIDIAESTKTSEYAKKIDDVFDSGVESVHGEISEELNSQEQIISEIKDVIDTLPDKNTSSLYNDGFEAGKEEAYDAFWNSYQANGTRTNYTHAFAGSGWNDDNVRPKYDIGNIVLSNAYMMFSNTNIVDIAKLFPKINASKAQYMFYSNYKTRHIGEIVVQDDAYGIFEDCSALETVDKFVATRPSASFTSCFKGCSSLKNIVIEANIGVSVNLQWSTLLSNDSIVSFINALSATSSEQTLTLSRTAVNNAFETSPGAADGANSTEWTNLIAPYQNWNFSLIDNT